MDTESNSAIVRSKLIGLSSPIDERQSEIVESTIGEQASLPTVLRAAMSAAAQVRL